MTGATQSAERCILMRRIADSGSRADARSLPLARCAGDPPEDPLQLYSLCLDCDLLHQQADRSLFSELSALLKESSDSAVRQRMALEYGHSEIRKMLERLSYGDPDARVALSGDIAVFRDLEPLLNQVAEFLKGQIDDSHEVAIGLCEHYETLLKLAEGRLEFRASTDSSVELIAKLGELINLQAAAFSDAFNLLHDKEQELLSLTRLQRGIIDFLPDATFVIDSQHRVIAWNKAMAELSGVPEEEMLGEGDYAYSMAFYGEKRPLLIDLIDSDHDTLCRYYRTVEKRGTTLIAEGSVAATVNGSVRELWITASPLFDHFGDVIGAIESVRDITEFKQAALEREQLKDQLHHAQKLDSIGQLAGGIAHEFNNILAAIIGYAGILEMRLGDDSPNVTEVRRIIAASERAASLTRGMLTFSRKQIVELEPVSLNSFIFGMKDMLCRLAGENIRLDFDLDTQELTLNADKGQLQQIVLNLYNNARDAMSSGGIMTISTSARRVCGADADAPDGIPPGRYALLTVADTGQGIRPEVMDRIFDPFFSTKEVGKGTGLGLSMVFGIIRQHDGFIKVVSSPGQGTVFTVWFPEYVAVESDRAGNGSLWPLPEEREGRTVLVGEDNEDVRMMIVELLQDFGFHVLEARDGIEVVKIMADFGDTVDLLLLDVIMPHMNGYDALTDVRVRYPDIPCLFLSGYSDDILKQKAKISGEFVYLSKPVRPDALIAAVCSALDRDRQK